MEQLCPVTGSKGTDEFRTDRKVTETSLSGKPFMNRSQGKMGETGPDGSTGPLKVQGDRLMSSSGKVMEITDQNFADTVESANGLTVVDFWAEWCGPCRMVAPIVEQLAEDYDDEGLKVGKLDVDQNQEVTTRFAVRSIPSILFFRDGQHVDTVVGAVARTTLEAKVQEHM